MAMGEAMGEATGGAMGEATGEAMGEAMGEAKRRPVQDLRASGPSPWPNPSCRARGASLAKNHWTTGRPGYNVPGRLGCGFDHDELHAAI